MDERDRTMNERDGAWCEREDLRHAYHRTRAEMRRYQQREQTTGKTPVYVLDTEEGWESVPMDAVFWQIVAGGLAGLRRLLEKENGEQRGV